MPLLLIYGREDRGRAAERVELLKQRYPNLNLHVADGCNNLLPWHAADMFHTLAVPLLTRLPRGELVGSREPYQDTEPREQF